MIVPMKKVTLLTLTTEENSALTALRKLGVMQVELQKDAFSESTSQREVLSENTRRIVSALEKIAAERDPEKKSAPSRKHSGAELVEEVSRLLDTRDRISGELDSVTGRLKELSVWGNFKQKTLRSLQDAGVRVYLCAGNAHALEAARRLEQTQCYVMEETPQKSYFVLTSLTDLPAGSIPEVRLSADDDPGELREVQEKRREELELVNHELEQLSRELPIVRRRLDVLNAELEYSRVYDSLADHGAVSSIVGFVPEPEIEKLQAAARSHGWGLLVTQPGAKDRVPTLLKVPKSVQLINPLFKFLGIAPGYDEMDVSAGVLVFFTIFYAMIVGDAGYGTLFLIASLIAAWKFRGRPAAKLPIRLFLLLSAATIAWGALCGNWFGTSLFPGIKAFTDSAVKDANTKAFCFVLAVAQLSLGRIWRAVHDGSFRSIVRNVGWMLILWGNFFLTLKLIVWPGDFPQYMYYLYAVGLFCVVCCDVDWKNPADIFQFPFNIIGSFVDVLSYIRLFAVGMAGYYIAVSFNGMGKQIYEMSPWFVLGAILVILFGHVLNVSLCVMSVLVHGVRLNTLEFSNHVGLRWGGSSFKPFKDIKKSEEN